MDHNAFIIFSLLVASTLALPLDQTRIWSDKDLQLEDMYTNYLSPAGTNSKPKSAVQDPKLMWPNGIIPYVITPVFDQHQLDMIQAAMVEYHTRTCIRFVPRTDEEDYVVIGTFADGCGSKMGRMGGPQLISVDSSCFVFGIILHELMHTVGFFHEHNRADRDDHVTINLSNIQVRMRFNFEKDPEELVSDQALPYDYGSVMHYGAFQYAIDPDIRTIITRVEGADIGQRRGFSEIDVQKINALYECPQA